MTSPKRPSDAPFASSAGINAPAPVVEDPYVLLDELMAAVEALCPEWPERPPFKDGGRMLL